MGRAIGLVGLTLAAIAAPAAAAPPTADRQFVDVDQPLVAFTHIALIDGAGGPARRDMTVVVRDGRIVQVGPSKSTKAPAGAREIAGRGKTLLPGFVLMHEHLYYPTIVASKFGLYPHAFTQLSLAGGATTIRTAGALDPQADLAAKKDIDAGRAMGPDMDVTGPYLNGASPVIDRVPVIRTPDEATQMVDYWVRQGASAFKGYQRITRDELSASIQAVHRHGLKIAGHLCSVTAAEAAAMGIDSLEHGFNTFTDFVPGKQPDVCPPPPETARAFAALDPAGPQVEALMDQLVARKVAITSTLGVMGMTMAPSAYPADPQALELLGPDLQAAYRQWVRRGGRGGDPVAVAQAMRKVASIHQRFMRKGGLLMVGSDPTTSGVLPGFSAAIEYRLMTSLGFTPAETLQAMTLNGARYLGREAEIGSIAPGKRADLVLLDGDLTADPAAIGRIETVFKAGVGYSRARILAAYKGQIGYTDSYAFAEDEH